MTWQSLADTLGTTPRSLSQWRREMPAAPVSKEPGEWRAFMRANSLGPYGHRLNAPPMNGAEEPAPTPESDIAKMNERELKVEERREKLLLARSKRLREDEKWIPKEEAEHAFALAAGGFKAAGDRLPVRSATRIKARGIALFIAFFRKHLPPDIFETVERALEQSPLDFAEVVQILEEDWQEVLRSIYEGKYLTES